MRYESGMKNLTIIFYMVETRIVFLTEFGRTKIANEVKGTVEEKKQASEVYLKH